MQWIGERSLTPEDEYPLFSVTHHTITPITVIVDGIMEVDTGAADPLLSQHKRVFSRAHITKVYHSLKNLYRRTNEG